MILASGARGPGFADFPGIDEICWSQAADRKVEHARALFQYTVCVVLWGIIRASHDDQLTLRSVGSMSEVPVLRQSTSHTWSM